MPDCLKNCSYNLQRAMPGGALGAACAAYYIYFGHTRKIDPALMDGLKGSYLGTEYSAIEIEAMGRTHQAVYKQLDNEDELLQETARLIAGGAVIGWHQGPHGVWATGVGRPQHFSRCT
jgi:predicted NodU family carbamoyl transferase